MPELKRALNKKIQELFKSFPAVVLVGARQVGKTTLLKQLLPKANYLDLENSSDLKLIKLDPLYFLSNTKTPLIIDEAQLEPELFKALRVVIDSDRKKNGRFLLSGLSSPNLLKNISESLAGRVAIVEVPNLDWREAYELQESNFAKNIFQIKKLKTLSSSITQTQLMNLCLYGSYPEPFLARRNTNKYLSWQENYIKTYIERDIRALFPTLNLDAYKRFISMLAFSSGEIINKAKFASSLDVSEPTIQKYLEIAEGTFLWRKLKPFSPNTKKRLIKSPRSYLRDTGLINYFLKIKTVDQLRSHPNFGNIWEIFVIEQILKNLDRHLINYDSSFYRTKNGAEVDLVIESYDGIVPIEIKSGSSIDKKHISHLSDFIREYNCPHGILINNADKVVQVSQDIIQVPACFL